MSSKKHISELYDLYEDKMQQDTVTDEAEEIRKEIIDKTDEIKEMLTKEQFELVEHILELEHQRNGIECKETFIYAFSLAMKLVAEGISNKNIIN